MLIWQVLHVWNALQSWSVHDPVWWLHWLVSHIQVNILGIKITRLKHQMFEFSWILICFPWIYLWIMIIFVCKLWYPFDFRFHPDCLKMTVDEAKTIEHLFCRSCSSEEQRILQNPRANSRNSTMKVNFCPTITYHDKKNKK